MAINDFLKGKKYKEQLEQNKDELEECKDELELSKEKLTKYKHELEQHKEELTKQRNEVERLNQLMTPEMQKAVDIQRLIRALEAKKETYSDIKNDLIQDIEDSTEKLSNLDLIINEKEEAIIKLDEEILVQEFGIYTPKYDYANVELYKQRLDDIRLSQKELVKSNLAATGSTDWTVNGSKSQGTKMVKDMQKLLLRAFNSECDELISKVKYNNFEASLKKITSSRDIISKLGIIMSVAITQQYFEAKIEELKLSLEYQIKKQEEKETLREARQQMREEAKLQKEIEEQRRKIEKEQSHYTKALADLEKKLSNASDNQKAELLKRKEEIMLNLDEVNISLKDIDYREANQKAGYVYIISNIGAFGENIYKIGMTRRIDPLERVDELGDASVPFDFDVHAMIFTDNAPKLEAALHNSFDDRKLNMVNKRREFFNVTLEEIKKVVKENFDKTVEFIDIADAEQYRISQKIKQKVE